MIRRTEMNLSDKIRDKMLDVEIATEGLREKSSTVILYIYCALVILVIIAVIISLFIYFADTVSSGDPNSFFGPD